MKYVIQLPEFAGRYLCHTNTNIAVLYAANDHQLEFDLQTTGGSVKKVTGDVFAEIFYGIRYANKLPSSEEMRAEYQLNIRAEAIRGDARQMNLSFEPKG
jgi:hypothetical protein